MHPSDSDLTDISYLLSKPRLGSIQGPELAAPDFPRPYEPVPARAEKSVMLRLASIIGSEARQADLLCLRKTVFARILGNPTRSEARLKTANESVYESHRSEILPLLENPAVIREVGRIALTNRSKAGQKEAIMRHLLAFV
jgi:hypothetical protein